MKRPKFVLGIDGGGSKTTALLARSDGTVVGRGTAGASNFHAAGHEAAEAALAEAAAAAFGAAKLSFPRLAAVCLGLSGVDRPHERAHFTAWVNDLFPGAAVRVVNDAELVLAAGTPAGWGVALICGTGSIVYGRGPDGSFARAGGWGHVLGDEGSGYTMGLAALRAVLRAYDGRAPQTSLVEPVLARWGLDAPTDLVHRVYQEHPSKAEYAALAPLVIDAGAAGDLVAQAIVAEAAAELALAVQAVVRRLDLTGAVPCALAGGLIVGTPQLQEGLLAAAARHGLRLDPVTIVAEPAVGAVRLALATC